jgi:hypothetical protein
MNVKNFFIAGLVGGIVDFLLGYLFYGFLFKDNFSSSGTENMTFIFLGCMTFGFFVSYIFTVWAGISNAVTGLKAGAIIGLFLGLYSNFFMNSMNHNPNYNLMALDMGIMIVMSALVGAAIALVIGKLK